MQEKEKQDFPQFWVIGRKAGRSERRTCLSRQNTNYQFINSFSFHLPVKGSANSCTSEECPPFTYLMRQSFLFKCLGCG